VTFVSDETDAKILNSVQDRFEVNITVLPAEIDVSSYSECCCCGMIDLHSLLQLKGCE
jgi:hypothetical protein